jgi:hypothetical protein
MEAIVATFTLKIQCDNDAFMGDPHDEIIRIMENIRNQLLHDMNSGPAIDSNGNTVGQWSLKGWKDRR